ncbi:MAG: hypothetical protein ACTSW3_01655 [Promethearchaeota archaeon]
MYRFIKNRRYVNLLFAIDSKKKKNILQLSKETNFTSSHLTIVMRQFEQEGLIKKTKNGREYDIEFTEVGKEVLQKTREYHEIAMKQLNKEKTEKVEKVEKCKES